MKKAFPYIACFAIVFGLFFLFESSHPSVATGSVTQGSEYHSTTTSVGRFNVPATLNVGPGALGSVVITGATSGIINIYDATTSNINQRAGTMASSSILLASFPASTAAGTYTFDALYYNGLLIDSSGSVPTTTITYR